MDIMSLFRSAPKADPVQLPAGGPTQVNQPGQALPGTSSSPQTAPNGMVPAGSSGDPTAVVSPFDAFKDVWQSPTTSAADPQGPMFGSVDPQKLMESAGKVDFAKAVTPEMLAAVTAGGPEAAAAFASAMNKVAQTVYAQSAFATTKIVDQALAKAQEGFDARLPSMVKKFSVNENLQASNPQLSNPALAPLVSALSEQLVRKNPNATSAEIQAQVSDYFAAIGTSFAPVAPETPASKAAAQKAKAEDWSAFF